METMTREELKDKIDNEESFLLVNVLSEGSFESLRIPGSKNADVHKDGFLEKIEELTEGDKDKEIVVYCSSFTCQASPSAARKLTEAGYNDVSDFEGGLADWKEAGYPLEGAMADK